jgi:hypothetical protein
MEINTGWKIGILRVGVILLFGMTCYQFGYSAGHLGGDWEALEPAIHAEPPGASHHEVDETPGTATASTGAGADDCESAG